MATRYIYLSEDLNNKLKMEKNASKIIQDLLESYYLSGLTPQERVSEIEFKEKGLINEVKELEIKKQNALKIIQDAEKAKAKQEEQNMEIAEKQTQRRNEIAELRRKYQKEVKEDNQSREGFEKYCEERGVSI